MDDKLNRAGPDKVQQLRTLASAPELLEVATPDDLRVAEHLRRDWPAELVAAATEQAALRQRAAEKFSRAATMLFTREGLEQASSEIVARHRAERVRTATPALVLDLCCGIGGDLCALGTATDHIIGVDRDERHALIARYNANAYGVAAATVVTDVHDVRVPADVTVFVDPARRSDVRTGGKRGGYSPALDWCWEIPASRVAVKAAPGLDPGIVPDGWEVEFVAVGRDLKEAVLWSPGWSGDRRRATILADRTGDLVVDLVPDPAVPPAAVRAPGRYLLDPSPAITRAGAVADVAARLDAWQVDPQIAFLSADHPLASPYGRGLVIDASLPFSVKAVSAELRRLEVGAIDIRRRGLAGDVETLRRRLAPRGPRRATVVLTRVVNKPWTFICVEPNSP